MIFYKRKMHILFVLLFVLIGICAAQVKTDSLTRTIPEIRMSQVKISPASRYLQNKAFSAGEKLVFDIAYGVIKAGTATMSIPEITNVRGRECFHVVTTAHSNKFFSSLYKVRDTVETYIDVRGIFPWKFEKHIREGKYKANRYVEYYQEKNLVVGHKKKTIAVPQYIQGILSSFYFVRIKDLKVGKHFDIYTYGDGKMYPLRVLVHKKETVKVPAGKFKCIMVEPVLQSEGLFNQKGRLRIWLTDDERKIPVLMKSKILVGSIDCRLRSYSLSREE